jgi:hypothetical protein
MKILYLPLEFNRFFSARKFPYPLGCGMVEGFKNIEHLTIPALYNTPIKKSTIASIIGDQKFDQVWLEVVHSQMSDDLLDWLTTIAPIRVGFVVESLTIDPKEFISNQLGTQRRVDNLNQKLPYLTHCVVTDERDLNTLEIPTMLGIASIPQRLVKTPSGTADDAIFYGTLYGDRGAQIKDLEHTLNINPPSAEDSTGLPRIFDDLFVTRWTAYDDFYTDWYRTRQTLYSVWINHLHNLPGCGFLNPRHRTNVLSSRVIEGMAAGKPVISPLMGNGVDTLFTDCEDILYYDTDFALLECIINLGTNSKLRFALADAARVNILENHTTERRVQEILNFTGV